MKLSRRAALKLLGVGAVVSMMPELVRPLGTQLRNGEMLHYIHPDHIVGDVHPFFFDGTWNMYYLAPGFYSKLMTSTDLIHWQQVPITHEPPTDESPEIAPYFVLGVFRDDINQVFRTYHGWTANNMHSHVSDNLMDWRFAPNSFRVLAQYARYSQQRDPYVFWNEVEGQYWCVMTCKVKGYDDATNGAVGYASSPDLEHWEGRGDLFFTGNMREPEVPQIFSIDEKWYLLASIHTGTEVGKPSYWMSDAPSGPWTAALTDSLDGQHLQAANVGFDGERWLLFGWIPLTTEQTHGHYTWGGHLAFPREIYPLPNGELGVRLEPAFAAAVRGSLLFDSATTHVTAISGSWSVEDGFHYRASDGDGLLDLGDLDARVDVDIVFTPSTDTRIVALRLNDHYEASIDLHDQLLSIGTLWTAPIQYANLPVSVEPGRIQMRILIEKDMVEMFVNDRYALAARLPRELDTTALRLVATGGDVDFEELRVFHLLSMNELA